MSEQSKSDDMSTPLKQTKPSNDSMGSPETSSTLSGGAAASNAASPQKQLNPAAKIFVPKLDDKSLLQSNNSSSQFAPASTKRPNPGTPSQATRTPHRAPPPPVPSPFAGMPPAGMMPGAFGGAPAGFNPMLNPMMLNPVAVTSPLLFPGAFAPSPLVFNPAVAAAAAASIAPPPSPLNVNVGNASLAALRSKEPPKFCCVLLIGLPSTGKTTVGRELVQGLNADKMPWAFFSGSDHMSKESGSSRPAPWDTTKEVFQALSNRLDSLLAKQADPNDRIKGIVIDKNCRGVEDLFYLTALLRAKGLPLVGVVGLEAKDDNVLLARMGGYEELREKLKHHRGIQSRIAETARAGGIYRGIDSTKPKDQVVQAMRTMVLGCSAQPPTRTIVSQTYSDITCPMVDSFEEYCRVMSTLFTLLKPGVKGPVFPGFTEYTLFTTREMEDRKKIAALKEDYVVRRRVDGVKHVLLFDGSKWYLIPRHMRAVFSVRTESCIAVRLKEKTCVVLDGDLVRLTKDRSKEKFVVSDIFFFSAEDDPMVNSIGRATWADRQVILKTYFCDEVTSFFPVKVDMIVVRQQVEEWHRVLTMLEPFDYPSDGIIMQPRRASDPSYVWRPPLSVTVDLRLGAEVKPATPPPQQVVAEASTDSPVSPSSAEKTSPDTPLSNAAAGASVTSPIVPAARTFTVEVYSRDDKKYVLLGNDTVEVRRPEALEGCICVCGFQFEEGSPHRWTFHRVRTDVARAAYKNQVEDLMENGLISRSKMVTWLQKERLASAATTETTAAATTAPTSAAAPPPPPPPSAAATVAPNSANSWQTGNGLSRGAFGMALDTANNNNNNNTGGAGSSKVAGAAVSMMLQKMVPSTKFQSTADSTATTAAPRGAKQPPAARKSKSPVATEGSTATDATVPAAPAAAADAVKRCAECKKEKKPEDLRLDRDDSQWYCYACWAKSGTEFCADCGEFAKGSRESTRRHTTAFYCEGCWAIFNKEKENEKKKGGASTAAAAPGAKAKPAAKKSEAKPATADTTAEATTSSDAVKEKKASRRSNEKKKSPTTKDEPAAPTTAATDTTPAAAAVAADAPAVTSA